MEIAVTFVSCQSLLSGFCNLFLIGSMREIIFRMKEEQTNMILSLLLDIELEDCLMNSQLLITFFYTNDGG